MTLNLTSDLVSINCIESGAYLLCSLIYEFQISCVNASWNGKVGNRPVNMHIDQTSGHYWF